MATRRLSAFPIFNAVTLKDVSNHLERERTQSTGEGLQSWQALASDIERKRALSNLLEDPDATVDSRAPTPQPKRRLSTMTGRPLLHVIEDSPPSSPPSGGLARAPEAEPKPMALDSFNPFVPTVEGDEEDEGKESEQQCPAEHRPKYKPPQRRLSTRPPPGLAAAPKRAAPKTSVELSSADMRKACASR